MGGISLLSREQEKKKLFLELGNRFNLPKELIIYLYQVLMNSIKHDRDLQINFHKNILSSHFCGPSSTQDIDELLTLNNPFQYRYPLGRGNEWLIKSDSSRVENIMYYGYYDKLKPMDIIHQQIKMYGDYHFLLKPRIIRCREYLESLEGMERIQFINNHDKRLFDYYFEYLEVDGFNLICQGNTFTEEWFEFEED